MLQDLQFVESLVRTGYAPLEWKRELFGLDLDGELGMMRASVEGSKAFSIKDFQKMLNRFSFSFRDYHVSFNFFSTEYAWLPFNIMSAEGRFFITQTAEYLPKKKNSPFLSFGDEIISINGQPIGEYFEQFTRMEIGENASGTDRALAELYFTERKGNFGHGVPSGDIRLEVIRNGTGKMFTYDTYWYYSPEKVSPNLFLPQAKGVANPGSVYRTPYRKLFLSPHFLHRAAKGGKTAESLHYFGARDGLLPNLGKITWESPSKNAFRAYIFTLPNGRSAGYLRIGTYLPEDIDQAVADLDIVIAKMQRGASVLVIDQTNNPGGYVMYLYALASRLTSYPLVTPKHRIMLMPEDIYFAATEAEVLDYIENDKEAEIFLGEQMCGLKATQRVAEKVASYFHKLVGYWEKGQRFTDLEYFFGIDTVDPNPRVCYKKPILVLINGMDFSGADFLPAILQDNKRAVIMGSRTGGAGGYVETVSFPSLCGIRDFSITASFAERPGGRPIENLGVEPDIPYEVSVKDLKNNFSEYKDRILEELCRLSAPAAR